MIDTDNFPPRTFIRDADLISAFEKFDIRGGDNSLNSMAHLRTNTRHYFEEYLSQASKTINGKCSTVSAQNMVVKGLLHLHSVFEEALAGS